MKQNYMALKETNLGLISEINKQGKIPLELLQEYHLGNNDCTSNESLAVSLGGARGNRLNEADLARLAVDNHVNLIIWSAQEIKLYPGTFPLELERATKIVYRNKYGQYFPVCRKLQSVFYPGSEELSGSRSYLLLRLLNLAT